MVGLVTKKRVTPMNDSLARPNTLFTPAHFIIPKNHCLRQNINGATDFMHMLETP